MPNAQNTILVGGAVLAIIAVCAVAWAAWFAGRRHADARFRMGANGGDVTRRTGGAPRTAMSAAAPETAWAPDPALIDRVVRVVALLFIAAVGVVVAVSGQWADRQVAIYLLLAGATLFIVFMQDLLPDGLSAAARYWIESIGAVVFLTVLVGLTGGLTSPFFVGFFLLIGGASLAGEGLGPIALALGAALSYAVVGLFVSQEDVLNIPALAWIAFNVAALLLLAYVGTVAGGAQRRARDAALRLSRYDGLTGLYNRSAFFAAVDREIRRVERTGRTFCLLMLDLDDLKPVNDTFGHPAGDNLLRAITEAILRTIRATDTAGRYGGDEFIVLLPETDPDGAFVVAEKLRRDMATLAIRVQDRSVRTSVSLGLVSYPDDGQSVESLLSAVDAAMYEAKRRGKNQIVGYTTRTERVATSIGPERGPAALPRPRSSRVDDSRSAEIGLAPRTTTEGPTGGRSTGAWAGEPGMADARGRGMPAPDPLDPGDATAPAYPGPVAIVRPPLPEPVFAAPLPPAYDSFTPPQVIAPPVAAVPPAPAPAAPVVAAAEPHASPLSIPAATDLPPPAPVGVADAAVAPEAYAVPAALAGPAAAEQAPWVPAAPAAPVPDTASVRAAPAAATPAPAPATAPGSVPAQVVSAPAAPVVSAAADAAPPPVAGPGPSFPRIPSIPSLPPQPLREEPAAAPTVTTPARPTTPVPPRDAAAGLPPVPTPAVAPWMTRSAPSDPATSPRNPARPPDRQYIAFPIDDAPER